MIETIIGAVLGGLILALLLGGGKYYYNKYKITRQGKALVKWLHLNTKDEPGESHKTISEVAKFMGLSNDEIDFIVARNKQILRSYSNPELISVWRREPQSVYDKHGVLFL